MQDIKKYMAERDEVFRSLDWDKIKRFCLKWQIPIPKKDITFKAGVYKTILHMYSSTDKEKAEAIEWLTNHGFNLDLQGG